MTRAIGATTLAALEADTATPVYFVELGPFDSTSPETTERLHSALGTITWGGESWTGAGDLMKIGEVSETRETEPTPLRLELSGVNSSILDLVFSTNYYRRNCKLYLGALSDGALVEDPSLIFSGFLESIEMQMGGDSGDTVVATAESELILFKRSRDVRYSDAQLQSEFSGDLGLEYLDQVKNRKVPWRGQGNARLGTGGGGGLDLDFSRPLF